MPLSCSELRTAPVLCWEPLCSWLLGAILQQVGLRAAVTLVGTDVLGSSYAWRCGRVTARAWASAGFAPPRFPPRSSSWARTHICVLLEGVCLGGGVGKNLCFRRVCHHLFEAQGKSFYFEHVGGYSRLQMLIFLLDRENPETYAGQTPCLGAVFHSLLLNAIRRKKKTMQIRVVLFWEKLLLFQFRLIEWLEQFIQVNFQLSEVISYSKSNRKWNKVKILFFIAKRVSDVYKAYRANIDGF